MTRTDIHRPAAPEFDPETYDLEAVFDLDSEDGDHADRVRWVNHLLAQGRRFASHQVLGQCGHCGARLRYAALMVHTPTGQMIYVGEQCLEGRFLDLTAADFDRLRRSARLNRERANLAERIEDLYFYTPRIADLTYPQITEAMGSFISDLGHTLRTTGRLTNPQIEALDKVVDKHIERENMRAAEALLPTVDAPEGKTTVAGEVLSIRDEPDYTGLGTVWKMTVRDDRGFKVWVTVPAALRTAVADKVTALRGERVEFIATLTRSDRDASFSFGKRPTKARILDTVEV